MHHAPALTLTLQSDPLWRKSLRAGGILGILVALGWLAWHGVQIGLPSWSMVITAVVSVIPSICLLVQSGTALLPHTLSWQPAQALWMLQPASPDADRPPRPGRIHCMLSGQHWLLLHHSGPHIPTAWIPVSRRVHRADWHALQCAVFSPGANPPPTPQADE